MVVRRLTSFLCLATTSICCLYLFCYGFRVVCQEVWSIPHELSSKCTISLTSDHSTDEVFSSEDLSVDSSESSTLSLSLRCDALNSSGASKKQEKGSSDDFDFELKPTDLAMSFESVVCVATNQIFTGFEWMVHRSLTSVLAFCESDSLRHSKSRENSSAKHKGTDDDNSNNGANDNGQPKESGPNTAETSDMCSVLLPPFLVASLKSWLAHSRAEFNAVRFSIFGAMSDSSKMAMAEWCKAEDAANEASMLSLSLYCSPLLAVSLWTLLLTTTVSYAIYFVLRFMDFIWLESVRQNELPFWHRLFLFLLVLLGFTQSLRQFVPAFLSPWIHSIVCISMLPTILMIIVLGPGIQSPATHSQHEFYSSKRGGDEDMASMSFGGAQHSDSLFSSASPLTTARRQTAARRRRRHSRRGSAQYNVDGVGHLHGSRLQEEKEEDLADGSGQQMDGSPMVESPFAISDAVTTATVQQNDALLKRSQPTLAKKKQSVAKPTILGGAKTRRSVSPLRRRSFPVTSDSRGQRSGNLRTDAEYSNPFATLSGRSCLKGATVSNAFETGHFNCEPLATDVFGSRQSSASLRQRGFGYLAAPALVRLRASPKRRGKKSVSFRQRLSFIGDEQLADGFGAEKKKHAFGSRLKASRSSRSKGGRHGVGFAQFAAMPTDDESFASKSAAANYLESSMDPFTEGAFQMRRRRAPSGDPSLDSRYMSVDEKSPERVGRRSDDCSHFGIGSAEQKHAFDYDYCSRKTRRKKSFATRSKSVPVQSAFDCATDSESVISSNPEVRHIKHQLADLSLR